MAHLKSGVRPSQAEGELAADHAGPSVSGNHLSCSCRGVSRQDVRQRGHALCKLPLPTVDGLLVAHGDVDVAVAGELHQLLGGRPADRRHGGGEVAQVVEPEVGASDLVAGLVEAVARDASSCRCVCRIWVCVRTPVRG